VKLAFIDNKIENHSLLYHDEQVQMFVNHP